jgi:hypothetical protein
MAGERPDAKENVQEGLISNELWQLITRCCDHRPGSRPKAQDLVNDLQQILDGIPMAR